MSRPDAVLISVSYKRGSDLASKVGSILDIAEPLLQCDKLNGEMGHMRSIPYNGFLFVTRDPADSILYPLTSPKARKPRYAWAVQPGSNGLIRLGTLVDQPIPAPTPTPAPTS